MADPLQMALAAKSYQDFNQEQQARKLQEAIVLNKLQASAQGRDLPAALQIANAIGKARQAGDQSGFNDIVMSGKLLDKGIFPELSGVPTELYNQPTQQPTQAPQAVPAPFQGGEIPQVDAGSLPPLPAYNPVVDDLAASPTFTKAAGVQTILGYDQALASRAATTEGAKTKAQLEQELLLKPQIAGAEQTAKNAADLQGAQNKKAQQAVNMEPVINNALSKLENAPAGFFDKAYMAAAAAAGKDTQASATQAELEVLAANLLQNVPRMEGPQSDADRIAYERAAGDIANVDKPKSARIAAVKTIQGLNSKYTGIAPSGNVPKPGTVEDGYMYNGGDPSNPSSWKRVK